MSNNESQEEKWADPEHGNKYWNYFNFIAPYAFSLVTLLIIFYLFPKKKVFQFLSFVFFSFLALYCIIQAQKDKVGGLYFVFFYLPIYLVYIFWYFHKEKAKKDKNPNFV